MCLCVLRWKGEEEAEGKWLPVGLQRLAHSSRWALSWVSHTSVYPSLCWLLCPCEYCHAPIVCVQSSLQVLVAKMSSANPHFVRCIKPNNKKVNITNKLSMVIVNFFPQIFCEVFIERKWWFCTSFLSACKPVWSAWQHTFIIYNQCCFWYAIPCTLLIWCLILPSSCVLDDTMWFLSRHMYVCKCKINPVLTK